MVLFFRFEAVFMPETASEKEQLWQLGEARVFDQMTSDQASGGLKHEYYHLQDQHHDPFQMTRPIDTFNFLVIHTSCIYEVKYSYVVLCCTGVVYFI